MTALRLPADWEPHERCLMAWPGHETRPAELVTPTIRDFAIVARAIARFEPVTMLARPGFGGHAEATCGPGVDVVELDFDDIYLRDSGPLFAASGDELVLVDFMFNRWGSSNVPRERYAGTGALLAEWFGAERVELAFVLEGGSVSSDGAGTLIAVEASIRSGTRNPAVGRAELEEAFSEHLGIGRTIWLERGLLEDRTGGHADNVAVFVGPGRVLCQIVEPSDPNSARLIENRAVLEAAGLEVIDMPVLPRTEFDGRRLAVSYLNFFVGNGCVVAPLANTSADREGLAVLREAFPGREVVGVPGETLAHGGGGVHCITQHQPLLRD